MRGRLAILLVSALAVLAAGCTSTTVLLHRSSTSTTARTVAPTPSQESVYLAQLGAVQQQLGSAETQIPTSPRTPAAFAQSVALLRDAVRRLAGGLAAIKPPSTVAAQHAQLVGTIRAYASVLARTATIAAIPGREAQAGRLLIAATTTASQRFSATIAQIDSTLGRSHT